jgi:transcription elongation factor Elf1
MVFAPEVSQHVDETRVQHVWSCDSCGFMFETSVQVSRLRLDAQPAAA